MRRGLALGALAHALAGSTVLGGCVLKQTKPARTFVLDALAARGAPALSPRPSSTVGVLKVTVPGWLDRPQITGRVATSEIVTDDFARWGEPVWRGVQRVMAENLAALLPDRRVVREPFPPADAVDLRVEVTLTEAGRQADGSLVVEARWTLLGPKGNPLLARRSSHRAVGPPHGPQGSVVGASEALEGLSREIAEAIRDLPPDR